MFCYYCFSHPALAHLLYSVNNRCICRSYISNRNFCVLGEGVCWSKKLSWNKLSAVGTKLTCGCCCPSSSWLDPGTKDCNGSSLQAPRVPRFESNFPRKYRRSCLVITHSVFIGSPFAQITKNHRYTVKIYRYSSGAPLHKKNLSLHFVAAIASAGVAVVNLIWGVQF